MRPDALLVLLVVAQALPVELDEERLRDVSNNKLSWFGSSSGKVGGLSGFSSSSSKRASDSKSKGWRSWFGGKSSSNDSGSNVSRGWRSWFGGGSSSHSSSSGGSGSSSSPKKVKPTRSSGTKPSKTKTSGSAGSVSAGSGSNGSGTAGLGTKGSGSTGSAATGSGSTGSEAGGSGTKGAGTKGSGTKSSGTKPSTATGSGTKSSGAKSSGTTDDSDVGNYKPVKQKGKGFGNSAPDYSTSKDPPPPYSLVDPNPVKSDPGSSGSSGSGSSESGSWSPPKGPPPGAGNSNSGGSGSSSSGNSGSSYDNVNARPANSRKDPPPYYGAANSYGQRGSTPSYWNGQYYPYSRYGYSSLLPIGLAAPLLLAGPFGFYGHYCNDQGTGLCHTNTIYVDGQMNSDGDLENGTLYKVKWRNGQYELLKQREYASYTDYDVLPAHRNIAVNGTAIISRNPVSPTVLNPNLTANGSVIPYSVTTNGAASKHSLKAAAAIAAGILVLSASSL